MCLIRITLANLCSNMINVDALDFSECRSKEVISFFWRSINIDFIKRIPLMSVKPLSSHFIKVSYKFNVLPLQKQVLWGRALVSSAWRAFPATSGRVRRASLPRAGSYRPASPRAQPRTRRNPWWRRRVIQSFIVYLVSIQIVNGGLGHGMRFRIRWKINVLFKEAKPSWIECTSFTKCEILHHCTNQYHSLFALYNTSNVN